MQIDILALGAEKDEPVQASLQLTEERCPFQFLLCCDSTSLWEYASEIEDVDHAGSREACHFRRGSALEAREERHLRLMIAYKDRRLFVLQVFLPFNLDLPTNYRTREPVEAPRYIVLYRVILSHERQGNGHKHGPCRSETKCGAVQREAVVVAYCRIHSRGEIEGKSQRKKGRERGDSGLRRG